MPKTRHFKNFQCPGEIGLRQIEQVLSSIVTIFEDFWQKKMSKKKSPKIRYWVVNDTSLVILSYINVYDVLSLARCSSVFVLSQFLEQLPVSAQWDRQ